jgi:hypothetical protein
MPKLSKPATAERVKQALDSIAHCGPLSPIDHLRKHAKEQKWNVTDSQLYRYLKMAWDSCEGAREKDREKNIARLLMKIRSIGEIALAKGDLRNARGCIQDEIKLLGLNHSMADMAEQIEQLAQQVKDVQSGQRKTETRAESGQGGNRNGHADRHRTDPAAVPG